jgi:hypothetical protein
MNLIAPFSSHATAHDGVSAHAREATSASSASSTSASGGEAAPGDLYAGVAFEVRRIASDGSSQVVDPATYTFKTGDRFTLSYRPSLPGVVEVVNTDPHGVETTIDHAAVAGGQSVTLGPYELTDATGDELLGLSLTPCKPAGSKTQTRDNIKVHGDSLEVSVGVPDRYLSLPSCDLMVRGGAATRTRDIRKVQRDGNASYALDPVSAVEISGNQYITRRVTIRFHRP